MLKKLIFMIYTIIIKTIYIIYEEDVYNQYK